ncbi:hypothetical protein PENTCL1PPCAC_23610, partial [Pristionchus entomophagus]
LINQNDETASILTFVKRQTLMCIGTSDTNDEHVEVISDQHICNCDRFITDENFVVDGGIEIAVHASKQILAHASPYFENLFFGDFEKPQDKEIIMEDISFT